MKTITKIPVLLLFSCLFVALYVRAGEITPEWYLDEYNLNKIQVKNATYSVDKNTITLTYKDGRKKAVNFSGDILAVVPNYDGNLLMVFCSGDEQRKLLNEWLQHKKNGFKGKEGAELATFRLSNFKETVSILVVKTAQVIKTEAYFETGRDKGGFNILSPDQNYVGLLAGAYGPILLYRKEDLLAGKSKPFKEIRVNDESCRSPLIYSALEFKNNKVIEFETVYCGIFTTYSYDIVNDRMQKLKTRKGP